MSSTSSSTLRQLRQQGADYLKERSFEQTALRDAELLLRKALGLSRASFFTHMDDIWEKSDESLAYYESLLMQRAQNQPLQYLLGEQEFYGLRFLVRPGVLIPRPETETLVEAVHTLLHPLDSNGVGLTIAEVGVGSGAVCITLASLLPHLKIHGSDIAEEPLRQTQENAILHQLEPRISLYRGDLLAPLPLDTYDAIISNPPYIPTRDIPELAKDVQKEPHSALDGGRDGLVFYRRLLEEGRTRLNKNGFLAVEVGDDQSEAVMQIAQQLNWVLLKSVKDLLGITRVLIWSPPESRIMMQEKRSTNE